jgi:hypothetical protein
MKRIVRLTESDLTRIVRRVISEQAQTQKPTMPSFTEVQGSCPGSIIKPVGGHTDTSRRVLRIATLKGDACKPVQNVAIDCNSNELLVGVTVINAANPNYFTGGRTIVKDAFGTHKDIHGTTYPNVTDINSSDVKNTLKGYCTSVLKYYTDLADWKKTQQPK